jgi:CheY-like chemotaxis protein
MTDQKTVLIIEDDPDMIEAMKLILESAQWRVLSAESPDEGLQKARQYAPDVIILDVLFGSQGKTLGFDCALKVRQDNALARIPILMVTSVNVKEPEFGFSPEKDDYYLPVDDFIDKPAQPDDLLKKLESLYKRKVSVWAEWPKKSSS